MIVNNVHKRRSQNVQTNFLAAARAHCRPSDGSNEPNRLTVLDSTRDMIMNDSFQKHSPAWVSFSYLSFAAAALMLALGIYLMPLDLWGKGYLTMGILMLVQTTVNVTKTIRDNAEADRLIRKVEDAKTEKLLLNINRNDAS